MKPSEQRKFIRELSKNIADALCDYVTQGKIPDTWDGHELRALLAERHRQSASMSLVVRDHKSKRAKDFENTVIVNNL
jgi:hypothetical protein